MITRRAVIALAAVLAPAACGSQLPPELAGFHRATGGDRWRAVEVVETRGSLAVGDLSGSFETVEDVRDGRSRTSYTIGELRGADGFDGTTAWRQDPGGEVTAPDAPEEVARARTAAWLTRRGYVQPDGARYRRSGARDHHAIVEATPAGGAPIELWFDDRTHLLARTVSHEGRDTVVTTLDDYRAVGGVSIPYRTVVDRGDPRQRVTLTIHEAHTRAALGAAAFARPETDTGRLVFGDPSRRTELPFELIENHIFIAGTVDGKPVRLIVDTGGLNLLTPRAVERLGLHAEGKLAAGGVGEQQVDVGHARARRLAIGTIELADPVFYVIDLSSLLEGTDIDGLVGFELFHRLAARIDYPRRRLTLSAPDRFTAPPGAIAVPFELADRTPIVRGAIDGIPARITIDTGARNSLTAHGPFSRKHELAARYKPRFETVTGWGVGGPVKGAPVRFGEVRLGGAVVRDVAGDLFLGEHGAHADPDIDANLGGGILRRFSVTFDYAGRTMYLEPGPELPRDTYDRLGAWLHAAGAAIRIEHVTPTSPAAAAGLRAGDLVVAIDGVAVTAHPLSEWRDRFRTGAAGTRVALTLERDGKRLELAATLAELLP